MTRSTMMATVISKERSHDPDQPQDADPARQDGRVAGAGRFLRQGCQLRGWLPFLPVRPQPHRRERVRLHRGLQGRRGGSHPRQAAVRDRKSTRLNSSHVKISYAVFCLKKKKKKK